MRKRTRSLLLSGVAILMLLVAGWQFYKYRFVHKRLVQAVEEKTKGLYLLHYDHLVFDEVAGLLHVRNIDILPDTAVYRRLVTEKREPHSLLQIHVDSIDIAGVKTPKALFSKELEGGKVEVSGARVRLMVEHFKKDSSVYNPASDLTKQLLGKLLKIAVDSIQIRNATVVVGSLDSTKTYVRASKVSLLLTHFFVDTSTQKDSTTILFSRALALDCQQLILPSSNKKYSIGVDSLRFTSTDNSLHLAEIKIVPLLSESSFAASFPMQKDRYDFTLKGVDLCHLDRKELWHKTVVADSLVIAESAFRIYRDLSRPPDTTSKVGKYPQQQLMHLPFPLSIRKIIFRHSFIEYKEKNARSLNAGRVRFHDVHAILRNVTNRREGIRNDNRCVVDFYARFLDKAPVDARLILFLGDPGGRFTIDGRLDSLDASAVNPLTEPMALTRLEKGKIDQLRFSIRGADSAADGRVQLSYRDLKVSMLKKDRDDSGYGKKGLASFFANIVIRNSSRGANPTFEDVHFQRILNKSIFNLIWKTLFAGIKKSTTIK